MAGRGGQISTLLLKRGFAAKAAALPVAETSTKVSRLPNGLAVATLAPNAPVSRVAVVVNAGSRHETADQEGVTHALRNAANMSNARYTGFHQTRSLHQIGALVSCSTTREHMVFSAEAMADMAQYMLPAVTAMALAPSFRGHEMDDAVLWRLKQDRAVFETDLAAQALEDLHRAAFRHGLGHSLICPASLTGTVGADKMNAFAQAHYVPGNAALVATGVEHEELVRLVQWGCELPATPSAALQPAPCAFLPGQESRARRPGAVLAATLGWAGAPAGPAAVPLALVQHMLGTGPSVKYSSAATSPLSKLVAGVTQTPFAVSALNLAYSDAGVLGVSLLCQAAEAGKVLEALTQGVPALTFTEAELARAKAMLRAGVLFALEDSTNAAHEAAIQLLQLNTVTATEDLLAAIDAATLESVTAAAKTALGGKASLAVVGNTQHTPYLDQLQ